MQTRYPRRPVRAFDRNICQARQEAVEKMKKKGETSFKWKGAECHVGSMRISARGFMADGCPHLVMTRSAPQPRERHMPIRNYAPAAIGLVTALAAPASAQDGETLCGVSGAAALEAVSTQLEGQWVSEAKAGYVVMGPMVMPHAAKASADTGRIELRDGRLTIVPDNPEGIDLALDWETGVDWSFGAQPSLPDGMTATNIPDLEIDDNDIEILTDCAVNDLPRLVGAGSTAVDGISMTFSLRLIVVNYDMLYGLQQVHGVAHGQQIMERRPIVMHR